MVEVPNEKIILYTFCTEIMDNILLQKSARLDLKFSLLNMNRKNNIYFVLHSRLILFKHVIVKEKYI